MGATRAGGTAAPVGRRERNMADKQRRIFDAAAALFDENGFEAVTTQQLADRADVAAGTLFRYASTKGELLLMVYNAQLRDAIEAGRAEADRRADPVDAVVALVNPVLAFAATHPYNVMLYQRELLFGDPDDTYRAEGIGLVGDLEAAIAARLARSVPTDDAQARRGAALAARSVFAVVSLLLAQPSTGMHPSGDAGEALREQIAQIVGGYLGSIQSP